MLKYTLKELQPKLSDDVQFEIFKQLLKLVKLLNAAGYQHSDIHPGNIMCDSKNKWYLIDYGCILHKKYKGVANDKYEKYNNDTICLILAFTHNPIKDYIVKVAKRNPIYPNALKSMKFLARHEIYPRIKKYIPKGLEYPYTNFEDCIMLICMLLDYNVYCQVMEAEQYKTAAKCANYKVINAEYYLNLIKKIKIMFY